MFHYILFYVVCIERTLYCRQFSLKWNLFTGGLNDSIQSEIWMMCINWYRLSVCSLYGSVEQFIWFQIPKQTHWLNTFCLFIRTVVNCSRRMSASNRSIHSSHIDEIHQIPIEIVNRPIPPVLDQQKVQSLMETFKVNQSRKPLNPKTEIFF